MAYCYNLTAAPVDPLLGVFLAEIRGRDAFARYSRIHPRRVLFTILAMQEEMIELTAKDAKTSALMKNDRFVLTKNDRHREHDLARANDWSDL